MGNCSRRPKNNKQKEMECWGKKNKVHQRGSENRRKNGIRETKRRVTVALINLKMLRVGFFFPSPHSLISFCFPQCQIQETW
jgi:hypothetical protein